LDDRSFTVVRVDLERPGDRVANLAQADAAQLPFPANYFDAVFSNHSLEHFRDLAGALEEIGRVVKPSGSLYVAVPDSSTLSDWLYRWAARGGGHVNRFTSARDLASIIERTTKLKHVATRPLCTSFSFLNRKNRRTRPPRRLWLVGGGTEISLFLATYILRLLDRFLGTRLSFYGWALYFGNAPDRLDSGCWTNVCIRCGSGHPSDRLLCVLRFLPAYRCPACGTLNLFTDDKHYWRLGKT
jgi:SAM-dependent methyltransferase